MGQFGSLYPYALLLLQLSALVLLSSARRLHGRPYFMGYVSLLILNNLLSRAMAWVVSGGSSAIQPWSFIQLLNIISITGYVLFLVGISKSIGSPQPGVDGQSNEWPGYRPS